MAIQTSVILLLFVLGVVTAQSGAITIVLHVDEDLSVSNLLGNIAALSNLSTIITDMTNVEYTMLVNVYDTYFMFESNSDLYLIKSLDREVVCPNLRSPSDECEIDIQVTALAGSDLQFINVHIVIDDKNDNAPKFSDAVFNITIQEGSAIDVSYELPMATDLDKGEGNGIQHYELEPNEKFRLDVRNSDGTTQVYLYVLNMSLDREEKDNYQLYVNAKDGGTPPLMGRLMVNITITDINDNRPHFSDSEYNITINETELIGTTILTVPASDRDIGNNAKLSYYFTDAQPSAAIYKAIGVNELTGDISVIGDLSSETGPFILTMEAQDHGNPVKKSFPQATITINVLDINDNAPEMQITLFMNGRISENSNISMPVAHIRVIDADKGNNSVASCTCDNDNFSIHKLVTNVFQVDLAVVLDRETEATYLVVINCSDKGVPSLSSSENFTLVILDENDNAPVFEKREYVANLTENNARQYVVLKVTATDSDSGVNAHIAYEIEPFAEQSKFQIDPNSGMIRVTEPLDRDNGREVYRFNVTARDHGIPQPKSDKVSVVVTVLDLNDNAPKFVGDSYAMSIPENQNMSVSIGQVTASDPDAGDNGKVSYMIPAIYALFPFAVLVDGTIITTATLDRENQSQYDFVVFASDHGNPPNKSSVPVSVLVLDENDNEPVIIFPSGDNDSISVAHNTIPDTLLITIEAHDSDNKKNKQLLYHIDAGNDLGVFQIDKQTGDIFLQKQVFNGDIKAYTLTISVKDQGETQLETRTTLHIKFYIANDTAIASTESGSKGQNVLIAIVISCVTFVLSVIIIIVICVIRRNDRNDALYKTKAYDEQKIMSSDSHRNSNRSNSSKGSQDKMIYRDTNSYPENNYQIRKNKKEVSFSLEEADGAVEMQPNIGKYDPVEMQLNIGQYDPVSTFRSPTPDNEKMNTFEQNYRQQIPPPPKPQRSNPEESKQRDIHRMASLRVHQALIQSNNNNNTNNNNNKPWPAPPTPLEEMGSRPTMGTTVTTSYTGLMRSPVDDWQSESSAELTTSDSGRGGSEEDIRAAMAVSHDTDDSRSPNTSSTHPFYTSESQQPKFTSFHGNGVHKTGPILSSFMKPSSHQKLHEESLKASYPLNDLSNPRSSSVNRLALDSSNFSPSSQNRAQQYPNSFGHKQSKTDSESQVKKSNLNFGHSFEDESMTARSQDDDDTTTSGSYTINDVNDDILTSDVTEMFYKPDTFV